MTQVTDQPEKMKKIVEIEEEKLELLVSTLETQRTKIQEMQADIGTLQFAVVSVLKLLGLVNRHGGIDEGYLDGTKNIFKPIFKQVTSIGADLSVIVVGLPGKEKKEKEMGERFIFMKGTIPLLKKYHKQEQEAKKLAQQKLLSDGGK